jgi:hypothetical protein
MCCEHCDGDFTPKNRRGRFCSAKCRKAAWQAGRRDTLARLRTRLEAALADVHELEAKG